MLEIPMMTTSLECDRKARNTRSLNIETPRRQSSKSLYSDHSPSTDRFFARRTVELREELPHLTIPVSQDVPGPHDLQDPDHAWCARRVHRGSTESCQGAGAITLAMRNELLIADLCPDRVLYQAVQIDLDATLRQPKQCQRLPQMPQLDRGSLSPSYSAVGSAQSLERIHTPFDDQGRIRDWWPVDRAQHRIIDTAITEQSLCDTLCISRHTLGTWSSVKSVWNSLKDKLLTYTPPYLTSTADAVLASLLHTGIVLLAKFEAGEEDYAASELYKDRVREFLETPKSMELIDLVPQMCRALRNILTALVYASQTYGHWFVSAAVKVDQELEGLDRYGDSFDNDAFQAGAKVAHLPEDQADPIDDFYQKNLDEPIRSILPSLRAWYARHIQTFDQYEYWDKALWWQLMSIDFLAKAKLAIPPATADLSNPLASTERAAPHVSLRGHDRSARGRSATPRSGPSRSAGRSRSKSLAKCRTYTASSQREGDAKDLTARRRVQNKSARSTRKPKDPDSFRGMSGAEQRAMIEQEKKALAREVAANPFPAQASKSKAAQGCKDKPRNRSSSSPAANGHVFGESFYHLTSASPARPTTAEYSTASTPPDVGKLPVAMEQPGLSAWTPHRHSEFDPEPVRESTTTAYTNVYSNPERPNLLGKGKRKMPHDESKHACH